MNPSAAQHIREAKSILDQDPDDLGSDEIAQVTGLALLAVAEHLGDIAQLMRDRNNER